MLPIAFATLLVISMPLPVLLAAQYLHSITSDNTVMINLKTVLYCVTHTNINMCFQPT